MVTTELYAEKGTQKILPTVVVERKLSFPLKGFGVNDKYFSRITLATSFDPSLRIPGPHYLLPPALSTYIPQQPSTEVGGVGRRDPGL